MLYGFLNGLLVVLSSYIGNLVSPHYIRFKKKYKRIRYTDDYDRALSSEELLWTNDTTTKMVAEVSKDQKIGMIGTTVSGIVGLLVLILSMVIFGGITMALLRLYPFKNHGALYLGIG